VEALEKNTTTRTAHEFQEGDLCYMPESAGEWARHGMAVIRADRDGNLWALDTYWDSWDNSCYRVGSVHLEFIINLSDCKLVDREICEQYADCDRGYIPLGAYSERWYVRKDAGPDPQRVREQLRSKIDNLEACIRSDQWRLEGLRKELAEREREAATPQPRTPISPVKHD
jgi:hypothetical protein